MIIIRPVGPADLDQLFGLAKKVAPGITTFPPNLDVLSQKIAASFRGFNETPATESTNSYLMFMENTENNTIMGTAAVYSNIGKEVPFYTFKILTRTQHSDEIEAKVTSNSLHLVNEYVGETEIGTLVLDPDYRGGGYGKLLSKCRYLLIAQFKERFAGRVFAELRGWSDKDSISPFWESVGKHFFNGMSYEQADYLSATTNNQFIADLMPEHPIYIELLSEDAQSVIGKPHATGEPALKMLFNEGFRYENLVDIFDAGPTVHAQPSDLASIKNSNLYEIAGISEIEQSGIECLICNTTLENFRVCQARVVFEAAGIKINQDLANAMLAKEGSYLRVCRV